MTGSSAEGPALPRGGPAAPPILVTGAAGFIGFHVADRLLRDGHAVVGLDSITPYYDTSLKRARLAHLAGLPGFTAAEIDLTDAAALGGLFATRGFRRVVHLAAQPGVRYALDHPEVYVASNLTGFLNVLEACRHAGIEHLVYASSSSVYGANRKLPFAEDDAVDHPVSLYAATKRANELMAQSYAHLFGIPATGLRFFTVYGPWGRPDMAVFAFTDAIARGQPIRVAAGGTVRRDFTYIDDVTEGVVRILALPPERSSAGAPSAIYNIGGDRASDLNRLIGLIEAALGRRAVRSDMPLPPGDVAETRADPRRLAARIGFLPGTPLDTGIRRFVAWYLNYTAADRPRRPS